MMAEKCLFQVFFAYLLTFKLLTRSAGSVRENISSHEKIGVKIELVI